MEINFNLFELYKFDDGRLSRVRFGLSTLGQQRLQLPDLPKSRVPPGASRCSTVHVNALCATGEIAESVARSVCGLVRSTTVLSRWDRAPMRNGADSSLSTVR